MRFKQVFKFEKSFVLTPYAYKHCFHAIYFWNMFPHSNCIHLFSAGYSEVVVFETCGFQELIIFMPNSAQFKCFFQKFINKLNF